MLCETCQWRREGYSGRFGQRLELKISVPCVDETCDGYKPLPPEAKRSARRQLAQQRRDAERRGLDRLLGTATASRGGTSAHT